MLSNQMYEVLSYLPRNHTPMLYEELVQVCQLSEDEIMSNLNETVYPEWNYVRTSKGFRVGSKLSLTEGGLVAIENYEQAIFNQRTMNKSLWVSIAAAVAAVASALSAVIPLITS